MQDWDEIFGPEGPLARTVPGFTTRPEQIAMAQEVARALHVSGRLIVEAGTGTGKTFAYLVPVLLSGKRVIVSTGTRTLQDQLFRRDLPTVANAMGRPVRVALLKGRANYLCLHRLDLAEQQAVSRGLRREVAMALPHVREWARITRQGDIAELARFSESEPVWPWVTSTRDNCLGPECPVFDRCHVMKARREAQAADVVVVNHHLLMADLVLKEEGFGDLLPGADAIVIDEAHQLPEVATAFLGFAISGRQLQALARDLAVELVASAAQTDVANTFAQTLDRRVIDLEDALGSAQERVESAKWTGSIVESLESLQFSLADLGKALATSDQPGLASVRRRAIELQTRLGLLLEHGDEAETASVRWAQVTRHGVSFHYVPVDVAEQLGELIRGHSNAWICTSATLAVGDDFEHFTRRIGIEEPTTARFGSPFDFEKQSLLYLPPGLDAPASSRHTRQVVEAALPVLEASGGRAFLLFTSHRALREAAETLLQRLGPKPPYPVLVQGDAPREVLLNRFRDYGNAVLLGTSSFWEGVDVKGAALSVVVIDKLPFAVPDDPVLKARLTAIERRGGNSFFEEQVPQAVIALKQGVGRLIRDADDFGVIMLCDQRLKSKPYGRIFLRSLPPMPLTSKLEVVTEFLRSRLAAIGLVPEFVREGSS
ncbi:ATP-dependent DNA helicase DinG [Povalibacter uvarum]|uniref:DNA 5'-3' helicase n=1 Tax=Povalibacter uvarum TaxID=732238 RepID=A0A841HG18_9GAMM|nr:ATP-dependent DNA helicase [Povalibacter uvarum]MBB6091716.1 ATP-dependent DNA helicase DinG [Povalibacter uvarum]